MTDTITSQEISKLIRQTLADTTLTLEESIRLIKRAEEKAASIHVPMVICVVDAGGNLVAQHRMDGALLASIEISHAKAYTAVSLRCPTSTASKDILPGASLYGLQNTHPGRFCLFGGGFPIERNGIVVGAIGVSGGSVEEDTATAAYAILT